MHRLFTLYWHNGDREVIEGEAALEVAKGMLSLAFYREGNDRNDPRQYRWDGKQWLLSVRAAPLGSALPAHSNASHFS